ncbi:hypothetical protein MSAN_00118200 [Mycena sanguinolenta]|uniref:Uncharacterized protein n=1 Tax=Mycena sanguinolenta TaxID=230812 RepID=A0A8H6ZDK6_9AGAR|nr:hypothetical protein MSAN_00118200 [Mycena sanguinolenta]
MRALDPTGSTSNSSNPVPSNPEPITDPSVAQQPKIGKNGLTKKPTKKELKAAKAAKRAQVASAKALPASTTPLESMSARSPAAKTAVDGGKGLNNDMDSVLDRLMPFDSDGDVSMPLDQNNIPVDSNDIPIDPVLCGPAAAVAVPHVSEPVLAPLLLEEHISPIVQAFGALEPTKAIHSYHVLDSTMRDFVYRPSDTLLAAPPSALPPVPVVSPTPSTIASTPPAAAPPAAFPVRTPAAPPASTPPAHTPSAPTPARTSSAPTPAPTPPGRIPAASLAVTPTTRTPLGPRAPTPPPRAPPVPTPPAGVAPAPPVPTPPARPAQTPPAPTPPAHPAPTTPPAPTPPARPAQTPPAHPLPILTADAFPQSRTACNPPKAPKDFANPRGGGSRGRGSGRARGARGGRGGSQGATARDAGYTWLQTYDDDGNAVALPLDTPLPGPSRHEVQRIRGLEKAQDEAEAATQADAAWRKSLVHNPAGGADLVILPPPKPRKRAGEDISLELPEGSKRVRRPAASREMPIPLSGRPVPGAADGRQAQADAELLKKLQGGKQGKESNKRKRKEDAENEAENAVRIAKKRR